MNINDIKAALAVKASSMNITPVAPKAQTISEPPTKTSQPADISDISNTTKIAAKKPSSKKVKTKPKADNPSPVLDIEQIIATNLQAGVDYNTIPGCGKKPALLKAGAEHLAAIFGFRSTSSIINRIEDYPQFFFLYEVETTIIDTDGNIIATGLGSCNSKERKYQRTDFASNLNTILKMAKKRSYVDAILTACHGSGVFTQDIEDIANNVQSRSDVKEA